MDGVSKKAKDGLFTITSTLKGQNNGSDRKVSTRRDD